MRATGGTGGTTGAIVACAFAVSACGRANDASGAGLSKKIEIPLVTYTAKYPNGFELITDEDHASPTVAVNLSYRVGSRDDPPGRAGLAHLVEHLMFRGSRHVPMGEFEQRVRAAGGISNAGTDLDRTFYWERLPSHQLPIALWLESDRLLSALETIDDGTLAIERDVVKNEWRRSWNDVAGGDVYGMTQAAIFPEGHPYHSPTIGSPEDLDRVTLDDVKTFARRYYVASNATLVLVGDFDRDAVVASVSHWFGSLPKTDAPKRIDPARAPIPKLGGVTRPEVEADVDFPQIVVSWPGPRLYGEGDAEVEEYLDFLARVLGEVLVNTDKIARSVRKHRLKGELASLDELVITLANGTTADAAIDAVDLVLGETRRTRMDPSWVDFERLRCVTNVVYSLESFKTRASNYSEYRDVAGRALFAPTLIERYDAVRSSSVRDIKPIWFPDDARVITVVHPVKGAPIGGRLASTR